MSHRKEHGKPNVRKTTESSSSNPLAGSGNAEQRPLVVSVNELNAAPSSKLNCLDAAALKLDVGSADGANADKTKDLNVLES